MTTNSENEKRGCGEQIFTFITSIVGFVLGGMVGILLAIIANVLGFIVIVALTAIDAFFQRDIAINVTLFLQNIAIYVIYLLILGTAIWGGILGYKFGNRSNKKDGKE